MRERAGVGGWSIGRVVAASAATTVLAFAAVSCGSDAGQPGADGGDAADVTTSGGASVTNGEQLARSSGCAGCHGQNFGGGAGPSLVGLAGSEVIARRRQHGDRRHGLSDPFDRRALGRSRGRLQPQDAGQWPLRRRDRRHRRLHRDARRWLSDHERGCPGGRGDARRSSDVGATATRPAPPRHRRRP